MCFNIQYGWRSKEINPDTGKRPLVFRIEDALMPDKPQPVRCGKCYKCQLEHAYGWATRGMKELSMHENAMFLTLSYAPKHLPKNNTLDRSHIQKFIKRLRQHVDKTTGKKLRYIYCGEYGEKKGRAHYHAIIYGYEFDDFEFYKYSKGNEKFPIYTSATLEKLWPFGLSNIGEVTYSSIGYLAKYTTKKEYGEKALQAYKNKLAPFVQGSAKPAIGIPWLETFWKDVYPSDFVLVDGVKQKPPRTFDDWLEKNHELMFKSVKRKRVQKAYKNRREKPEEYEELRQYQKEQYLREVTRNQERYIE